jgi:putative transposase
MWGERVKQLNLSLDKGRWGGRRKGSGRKRLHSKGVAHRVREKVHSRHALHVNFKVKTSIRNKCCLKILNRSIMNSRKTGLKIIHYSLQSNHVHLIVEAQNNMILTKGMRSLLVTFAKRVNKGRIQMARYHLHVLKTLRETRHAVHYVLFNEAKHKNLKRAHVDEYSSLGRIRDFKKLAQESKMTIILRGVQKILHLDEAESWMMRRVEHQLNC